MNQGDRHIVCPHCDSINRVPAGKDPLAARCGGCHKPLFEGRPASVRASGFEKQVSRSDVPVVVDFWADWCAPCKMMAPHFEQATGELEPAMRFLKLDTEAEPSLAARFKIRGIPTTIVFKDGKEVERKAGAMDARTLANWLRPLAG